VDPRLRAAVDASLAWYDDVCALHGVATATEAGLWRALGDPPPWHSGLKTTRPGVDVRRVLAAHRGGPVADSFGDLDLQPHGFTVLIDGQWVHHPGLDGSTTGLPSGWSVVRDPDLLGEWSRAHDYVGVLLHDVLDEPAFTVLAQHSAGRLTGGAVLHRPAVGPDDLVGLSNAWTARRGAVDHAELLAVIGALEPGRAVTDYAYGAELDAMTAAGYARLGPQRVWRPVD
jgi:hypothetical protein